MPTGNLRLLASIVVIGGILATITVRSSVVSAANDEPQETTLSPAAQIEITHVESTTNLESLFSDYTFANLGVPRNPTLPFLAEANPDRFGFTANPDGSNSHDGGLGKFLHSNPTNQQWAQASSQFEGAMQTPTLRNVDLRPGLPSHAFVKASMHNGYFPSPPPFSRCPSLPFHP
ncbi:MAG: hypothetical protein M3Y72_03010 [Acidobacteriota bacterium]|nr:hypothetical protein [Acidobacteriota bacterium]